MPLAAKDNLDELYALERLLQEEAIRLQQESDSLQHSSKTSRQHILNVQIDALQAEATRLSARISDILERDLER